MFPIEWSPDALADVERIRPFDVRSIFRAVEELQHQADVETRSRKPLREPIDELPEDPWELRVGAFRVVYRIREEPPGTEGASQGKIVRILRVIFKGRFTMQEALERGRKP
jgi:mRNA-degrading endonuclease RelE of RelBE toxin-antitoxin system